MATTTIRLSLRYIILTVVLLLCFGIVGGALGSYIFSPSLPLTSDTNRTIVPVSQQVTVSPSKLAQDLAALHTKSVFLLAQETAKGIQSLGIGTALTNDGVIMSLQELKTEGAAALGEDGVVLPLVLIGKDELSGIFFYKASDRIVPPFNLLQNAPRTGSSFLALSREHNTAQLSASSVTFSTTLLPTEKDASGLQKIMKFDSTTLLPPGTPLIDENGNLAAVVLNAELHTALFVSDIRSALERLSGNRLAHDPFTSLGFTLSWNAALDASKVMKIGSVVASVTLGSPADTAGLETGDTVTAISGNTVSWDTNIVDALQGKPLLLTVVRKGENRTISIP